MTLPDDPFPPPIGILAGNGRFPGEVARSIRARGGDVVILGIDGEASADLEEFGLIRVGWGEVGRILRTFRERGCRELVIVGGVTRPDLTRIRPDMGVVWNLPEIIRIISSGGDDGVLSALVRLIEARGFRVVSPADVAPEIVVGAGPMGAVEPSPADVADMLLGSSIVKALGPYDVGQGVIVSGGRIEAIEAAEGTNRMIERVALRRVDEGRDTAGRGILVKRPKPGQEMRVDLPAIGPETVERTTKAGLRGIAVLAGLTLVTDRAQVVVRANEAGQFVYGFTSGGDTPGEVRPRGVEGGWVEGAVLTRRRPSKTGLRDARFGAAVLSRLAEACPTGAVVVRREHVLALEPDGAFQTLFSRVARHTQWGERRLGGRVGIAVLGREVALSEGAIAAAAESRLAGIAVMRPLAGANGSSLAATADKAGMFVIEMVTDGGRG